MSLPKSLGALRHAVATGAVPRRTVKDELRDNLITHVRSGRPLFPGIVGFDDTVIPQVVNAILSKHNFILLGLRGQAKTRLLRALVTLLDAELPVVAGCEIHDDPLDPLCAECRARVATEGDDLAIAWVPRDRRYVEKLATPDVTIADMIGDVDPIKAARSGRQLGDEMTMHYGLLPRAHRGIFAINELPDLASKVQVGLFNILQEGDVQIKGYPVRLRLDLALVFSANPEDYTARGKIITPLKDRIGSEIRTHYPRSRQDAMAITKQEAWTERIGTTGTAGTTGTGPGIEIPLFVREIVEEIAFQARSDQKIDRRSGVSQRLPITTLENVVSNAERRALLHGETPAVPRVSDVYASLPSVTGKIELEYEGELKGAEPVARDLVRAAVATVFDGRAAHLDVRPVIDWFDRGGTISLSDTSSAQELLATVDAVTGLDAVTGAVGAGPRASEPLRASAADFVLEGLCALKKISRSDQGQLFGAPAPADRGRDRPDRRTIEQLMEDDEPTAKGKKKYFN
jgi:magnesium chelatase subunit I